MEKNHIKLIPRETLTSARIVNVSAVTTKGLDWRRRMENKIIFSLPILPSDWTLVEKLEDGFSFVNYNEGQTVILSWCVEEDYKMWMHFSMACTARVPYWEELVKAKEIFLGVESKAIMVIPPRSEYVNLNKRVLHLFYCLDRDVLPDFTRGGGTL